MAIRKAQLTFVVALLMLAWLVAAQERDRAKIPDKYKWNLADLYPTEEAWHAAADTFKSELPDLRRFKGRLASTAGALTDALEKVSALDKQLARLAGYAGMLADQDTRDSRHQGMRQEIAQLASAFAGEAAFIEPEILRIDKSRLEPFIGSEPRLKVYRFYIEDIARRAPHTLT